MIPQSWTTFPVWDDHDRHEARRVLDLFARFLDARAALRRESRQRAETRYVAGPRRLLAAVFGLAA